jgi:divalent metal cation (Fe/Co/Zn/Cd) transporter
VTAPGLPPASPRPGALLARGIALERLTLSWNALGIGVLAIAAVRARSVALAGFGLDSLVEIGASMVVLWELADASKGRQARALRLIGSAFAALSVYVAAQSIAVLVASYHPRHSVIGIAWTASTVVVMSALATGKTAAGRALHNPVLSTEGRVTFIDAVLAAAVLLGLVLNAAVGAWWADPLAGLVIVYYGLREARHLLRPRKDGSSSSTGSAPR